MRRRRRLQHPGRESRHRKLGEDLLFSALSRFDRKGGLRLVRLWRGWEEAVGPDIAELAWPLGHKDGTLILNAADATAAQQLSYYVFELLERVNAFLGEEVFDKVRFELLDGRVPLGRKPKTASAQARPQGIRPGNLGGLVGKIDPESAVGRCYMAYVRRFSGRMAQADNDANTGPEGVSRSAK
jgi:predicted nucleic acid-binding Zn ribbon protein